jgi:hypothetical protein
MAKTKTEESSIGKFDILATYAYVKALLDGEGETDAKVRGIGAAIMGAKAKSGHTADHKTEKTAAEKKKKTTITAAMFNHQVADKMGAFFEKSFVPAIKKLVQAGLSYDDVKSLVKIPATWGAKISGERFMERVAKKV